MDDMKQRIKSQKATELYLDEQKKTPHKRRIKYLKDHQQEHKQELHSRKQKRFKEQEDWRVAYSKWKKRTPMSERILKKYEN